jgi:ribosomal protein L37AE/L43A
MLIGRVTRASGLKGGAEFNTNVRYGDFVFYFDSNKNQVLCQITDLKSQPTKGFHGTFKVIEQDCELPLTYTDLYSAQLTFDQGQLEIGKDRKGNTIKLDINPFFLHVYIAGMTGQGKTHTMIVLQEEIRKIGKIPSVVFDLFGELANLNLFSEDVLVTADLPFEDALGYLKERKTVVYNLQGLSKDIKTSRVHEFLSRLYKEKEQDYTKAGADLRLLQLPPILIFIDEAEIVAPECKKGSDGEPINQACKDTIIDIAKRGSKYGLGLVVSSQVAPDLAFELRSQCGSAFLYRVCDSKDQSAFRKLKFISYIEIRKIKDLDREHCIIAGELVRHPLGPIHIRDIVTKRTKTRDFANMMGIECNKVEIKPVESKPTPEPAADATISCPDCGKPMTWDKRGSVSVWACTNDDCHVIEVSGGKLHRSALARKPVSSGPIVGPCSRCGLPKDRCICKVTKPLEVHG